MGRDAAGSCRRRGATLCTQQDGQEPQCSGELRKARWEAAVGRRSTLSRTRRDAPRAARRPMAATQRRAAQGTTLRGGWREAAVGRRSALSCTRRHALRAARRPRAATQRQAAQGATLGSTRAARGVKGRRAARSCGISARLKVSGARRPRGRRAAPGCKGRAARSERRAASKGAPSSSRLQRARGSK